MDPFRQVYTRVLLKSYFLYACNFFSTHLFPFFLAALAVSLPLSLQPFYSHSASREACTNRFFK